MTDTLLIIAGDCGFGFENFGYYENMYNKNKRRLNKHNNHVLFVRGNHDNPYYFNECAFNHKRMKTIPDYSIITACGHTILCVGGGVSIDRLSRIETMKRHFMKRDIPLSKGLYWEDELPVFRPDIIEEITTKYDVDTVVTHTCPSFCEPLSKDGVRDWILQDPQLSDDMTTERDVMTKIYDELTLYGHPLTNWIYGHFHRSWHMPYDDVMFSMLDIEELKELRPIS